MPKTKSKETKTKTLNWERLSDLRVQQENQKLLIQARDRVRKYNKKYGTDYKVKLPQGKTLHDRDLYKTLQQITTKNIKKIDSDKVVLSGVAQAYTVNGVMLTRTEYKQMQELQRKANRLRGKSFDGTDYYKPYFTTYKGYKTYMARLERVNTKEGYLKSIARGLQTFKASLLDHLDDVKNATGASDKRAEIQTLIDWVDTYVNTYTRLDALYKYLKNAGYTGEQMARMFFDSDPSRNAWELGEDTQIIKLLKEFKGDYTDSEGVYHKARWKRPGTLGELEKSLPIDI